MDKKIDLSNQTVEKLESSVKELENLNNNFIARVNEISELYEVAKKMSKALKFEGVFKIFTDILKENFQFQDCKFIVFVDGKTPANAYFLDKTKSLAASLGVPVTDLEAKDKKIITYVKKDKNSIFISKDKKEPESVQLDNVLEGESLTVIPLFSGKKIIAILIITDLRYEAYSNLLIFTGQFSLQLRKVKLYEKIQELAIKDDLTGVFARRHFLQRFKEEFKRAARYHHDLALLMLDIDNFKKHNDQYGHLVGDKLLKDIANIIVSTVREVDLVGRFGGEEFALVLPDTDTSGAELVAERIRQKIQNHKFKVYDEIINITASSGTCLYPENTTFFDHLIDYADMALYRAKNEGRNRACMFDATKDKTRYHKI